MPKKFENKSKSHSTKTGIVFNPSKIKTKIVDYGGKEETQRRLEQGRSTMARQREGRRMTTACSPQRQWKRRRLAHCSTACPKSSPSSFIYFLFIFFGKIILNSRNLYIKGQHLHTQSSQQCSFFKGTQLFIF